MRSAGSSNGKRSRGCLRSLFTFVAILVVAGLAARWATPRLLEAYARWLIVDDPPVRTDAAVVLGGGEGERLFAAIQLYKTGKTGCLLITGSAVPLLKVYSLEDSLTQGEAKRRIAVRKGIPTDSALVALGPTSTWQEAVRARKEAEERHWGSITVVTDPFHTRRARATFRQVFKGSPIKVRIYHLPEGRSGQLVTRWWSRESDYMAVLTETMKLAFYVFNYHVRP
jgi:uncharacterized SAM-binding protein YcdF (DUF218 family)